MGVVASLHAGSAVPYWTSIPVISAYVLFGLSLVCFACAIREVPFPYTVGAGSPPRLSVEAPLETARKAVKAVRECNPHDLDVHQALPPTTPSPVHSDQPLTPYLKRDHDQELRAALHQAAGGGPSVFAVLAGDSSTGKTRALYEALLKTVPDWPLLGPADAEELCAVLRDGTFRTGTALWLNETQRHLYGSAGEQAAKMLRNTLEATTGAVAVGALWSRPYLEELTASGNSPDDHTAARALLLDCPHTHRITVPDCLTDRQQRELSALAAVDEPLAVALAASGPAGDVIQHLTGGPDLLHAYTSGSLFTKVEHALITAALDARRLGHQSPIPATLLAAAADGYLSPQERPGDHDWAILALSGLVTGIRPDGTRSGIRNALTALKTLRARSGDPETGYEPDDYLDQHTRQLRRACLGSPQLWDALAENTASSADLDRLGEAAYRRGLYGHAAILWKHAITGTGNVHAASRLINLLHSLDCDGARQAAHWVAVRPALDDPWGAAALLQAVREAGAEHAVVATLAARAARDATLDNHWGAAALLDALRQAGAEQAVATLAVRAANEGLWQWSLKASPGRAEQYPFGREPNGAASTWDWQDLAD